MVAAGLHGPGRDRAEAVLAEPDGCACRACGYTSHAEELQERLATRERRRLSLFLVGRPIGFSGHGHPSGQISMS
jgi:hypothetical protein